MTPFINHQIKEDEIVCRKCGKQLARIVEVKGKRVAEVEAQGMKVVLPPCVNCAVLMCACGSKFHFMPGWAGGIPQDDV